MKTMNRYLHQLFSFVLLAFLLIANATNVADAKPTASVVHDIQFILALKGIYKGPLDGNCGAQTIATIGRYIESAHEKQLSPIQCSGQLLATLIGDIGNALSATKAVPPVANQQQEITTEVSRINSQLSEIDDLKKKSEQIQENYHGELVSQFRQLATLSVSIIAVMLTGLWFIGTHLAKTLIENEHKSQREKSEKHYVEQTEKINQLHAEQMEIINRLHEEQIKTSSDKLTSMISIARSQTTAHIFTSIGSYCESLYLSLEKPSEGYQKELYESYLGIAVDLTKYGFINAEHLRKLIKSSQSVPDEKQSEILETCINNYMYFLAPKTLIRNDVTDMERADLRNLLTDLEGINPVRLDSWRLRHTIAWVRLHLDKEFDKFNGVVDQLLNDNNIDQGWKDKIRKKHDLYRRAHPEFWNNQSTAPSTPSSPQS